MENTYTVYDKDGMEILVTQDESKAIEVLEGISDSTCHTTYPEPEKLKFSFRGIGEFFSKLGNTYFN